MMAWSDPVILLFQKKTLVRILEKIVELVFEQVAELDGVQASNSQRTMQLNKGS